VADSASLRMNRDGLALAGERRSGAGPIAIFLHAGVTDPQCWNQVHPRLTSAEFSCLAAEQGYA
jgi:hypothetical protein